MTWFRGMEKRGTKIHWIDGTLPMEEKVGKVLELFAAAIHLMTQSHLMNKIQNLFQFFRIFCVTLKPQKVIKII
jgi:hypothetical protein